MATEIDRKFLHRNYKYLQEDLTCYMQCLSFTTAGKYMHKEKKEVIFDNIKRAYGTAPIVNSVNRENK